MTKTQFFIGFGVFEDLLDAIRKDSDPQVHVPLPTLYLESLVKSGPGPIANIRVRQFYVIATVVIGAECWYWRMTVSKVDDWGPVAGNKEKLAEAQQRSEAVAAIMGDHATKQGFNVVRASVAFPAELQISEGTTDLLGYDKEKSLIIAKEQAA